MKSLKWLLLKDNLTSLILDSEKEIKDEDIRKLFQLTIQHVLDKMDMLEEKIDN